jgi:hypothetical protein
VVTITKDADIDPRLATRLFDISQCQVWEITAPSYRIGVRAPAKPTRKTRSKARGRKNLGVSG